MKLLKKLSCFIVATCMAISCVACSSGDTTWAYEYDDITVGSGLYIAMSISAYIQASYQVTDYTQSILSQYVGDVPAKEWILDKTQELTDRYIAVENEFSRLGLELSADDIAQVEVELKNLWNSSGDVYEANGVGRNSYRLILENSRKEEALFYGYYGEGGESEVLSSELFDYFKEEYAVINAFTVTKEYEFDDFGSLGEETDEESDEESGSVFSSSNDKSFDKAQGFADRINAGESFNEVMNEYIAELEALAEVEVEEEEERIFEIEYIDAEDAEEFKASLSDKSTDEEATDNEATDEEETDDEETDDEETDDEATDDEATDEEETDEEETDDEVTDDEATDDEVTDDEETDEEEVEIADDNDTKFAFSRSSTSPSAMFVDSLFQFQANGKAEVIDETSAYYVVVRYEPDENDDTFLDIKETLLMEIKNDEFSAFIEEVVASVSPTATNQNSITRYDPKNIDI